jgi:hypothetical protein
MLEAPHYIALVASEHAHLHTAAAAGRQACEPQHQVQQAAHGVRDDAPGLLARGERGAAGRA